MSEMYTAAILITSDRAAKGEYEDKTAAPLRELLTTQGYDVVDQRILPDDEDAIAEHLQALVDRGVAYIVTSGGTGVTPRDVTPEATRRVIDKEVPGLAEMLRARSLEKTVFAVGSRGLCGVAGKSLILNCPGSTKGALEYAEWSQKPARHLIDLLHDTNASHK